MAGWRVGSATITPVVEVDAVTSPRFLFSDFGKADVIDLAQRVRWFTRGIQTGDFKAAEQLFKLDESEL